MISESIVANISNNFMVQNALDKCFEVMQERKYIDTWEQLSILEEAIQSELDALCSQRKGLYTARRKNLTETDLFPAIESINQSIKILRRELKICGRIEADGPVIRRKLMEPLPAPPKVEKAPKQRPRKWHR